MLNRDKVKSPIVGLYTSEDIVAKRHVGPMSYTNHEVARREFVIFLTDKDTVASKNPSHFRMWYVGDFDPDDGQIDVLDKPELVVDGSEVIGQLQQQPDDLQQESA